MADLGKQQVIPDASALVLRQKVGLYKTYHPKTPVDNTEIILATANLNSFHLRFYEEIGNTTRTFQTILSGATVTADAQGIHLSMTPAECDAVISANTGYSDSGKYALSVDYDDGSDTKQLVVAAGVFSELILPAY